MGGEVYMEVMLLRRFFWLSTIIRLYGNRLRTLKIPAAANVH